MKQKFDNRGRCCGLTNPEKEHPLDDFGFHFRSVLFGHQSFGQIDFLLMKSEFQAFGNSSGFWRLYISGFQNTKDLCGAHGKKFAKSIIPFLTPVHSDLLSLGKDEPADKPMKKRTGKAHRGSGSRKLGADVFECRAGLRLRLLYRTEKTEQELIFFEVGNHDDIRRVLKRRP